MRHLLFVALAMSAGAVQATNIWMSTSDIASPLGETPAIDLATGTVDQRIHIWARPDEGKELTNWSLNLRSTTNNVIEFTDVEVYNPVLREADGVLPRWVRHEFVNDGEEAIRNRNFIEGVAGFNFMNRDVVGAGLSSATKSVDPFYDPINDAWLLASATFDVIGPGRTDLFLQIGHNGIMNAGEDTGDHYVVFGNLNDPQLNGGNADKGGHRGVDSATPDATIAAHGKPVFSWDEKAKIAPGNRQDNLKLGWSVAISGDRMILGGRNALPYVFERSGTNWNETAVLATSGRGFPWDARPVAVSNDRILVGGRSKVEHDENGIESGAVFVFEKRELDWAEVAAVWPSDPEEGNGFATALAISGDRMIVGAPRDDDRGAQSGSAYIFEKSESGWSEAAKLTARDAAQGDRFGKAVALDDDRVVVGAARAGITPGSAYIFEKLGATWTEVARLTSGDATAGDDFGASVAMSGNRVVVGAPRDDDNGRYSGSAYIFEKRESGWAQVAKLTPKDGTASDWFGNSVAISGDRVVIGATSGGNREVGAAYVFEGSGAAWNEVARLAAGDGHQYDRHGFSVAMSGDTVVVGAPVVGAPSCCDQRSGPRPGSAYVYGPVEDYVARMITGSPVALAQTIDTPAEPFELMFDYRFLTPTGELDVLLEGISVGTIVAPGTLDDGFVTASFLVDGAHLEQAGVELRFELEGATGSTLLLDSIVFPFLENGEFHTGDISGWTATATGNGSVEAVGISAVPEPPGLALAFLALFGFLWKNWEELGSGLEL
ncbi:MAG: FG-GAP repeat protein [Pirellulaceae bacterium]